MSLGLGFSWQDQGNGVDYASANILAPARDSRGRGDRSLITGTRFFPSPVLLVIVILQRFRVYKVRSPHTTSRYAVIPIPYFSEFNPTYVLVTPPLVILPARVCIALCILPRKVLFSPFFYWQRM